ncbi:hypothetical protein GCM10010406_01840 [Streptomyces thermolineatus]|uniref:Uncharacterized protein n=1 Tax=Streptomyces thermolineatus TaxID=44033 RepID=A0ABN3KQV3_9ACTN
MPGRLALVEDDGVVGQRLGDAERQQFLPGGGFQAGQEGHAVAQRGRQCRTPVPAATRNNMTVSQKIRRCEW